MSAHATAVAREVDTGNRNEVLALLAIVTAGAILRVVPVAVHDWPIADGGLFYAMVGDILHAGFVLPDFASYQGGAIPFAYPPLALYIAAGLEGLTGMARADVMRVVPVFASLLCVAALYLVAREAAPSRRHALVAAGFYAALTAMTAILIAGGGLTRAMGVLLALLAVWQGLRMYATERRRHVVATSILSGFALLSHPEAGPFIAIALGSALLFHRHVRALLLTVAAAMGALLVAGPWLLTILGRHGLEPFRSALGNAYLGLGAASLGLSDSVVAYVFIFLVAAPVVGILDIAGQVRQLAQRRLHLITWRAGVFAFDLRLSPIAAAPPVTILASVGALDLLVPLVWRGVEALTSRALIRPISLLFVRRTVVVACLVLAFVPAVMATASYAGATGALTAADREAMTWVRDHTPPATKVVVVATDQWGSDHVSEWLPALAERTSLTTSQGYEWAGPVLWPSRLSAFRELRTCHPDDADCLVAWLARHASDRETVIFLAGEGSSGHSDGCCDALIRRLSALDRFRTLWTGSAGTILARSP